MFSCDYNGWADVPEEEREGIDTFEASLPGPMMPVPLLVIDARFKQVTDRIQLRAA